MKRAITATIALLLAAGAALADSYRVHYSVRGSGRDITVQAESSAEARRTVIDMFPGAVVTGVHRLKK
jgi:predicted small secreted protein